MATNLGPLYISSSFQQLVTVSASAEGNILADGTGSVFVPISASHAITASFAENATSVVSSSYALSASHADSADSASTATSASHAVQADSATSASHALNADNAISASHALNADNAISSSYATFAQNADEANDLVITVKNVSGGTLAIGTAVHPVGVTGENIEVVTASADQPSNMPAVAVLSQEISNNASGTAIINGRLIGIDTSNLVAGQPVYVANGGLLTATKPTGSSLIQNIGTAAKINASDGEVILQGSGRSNDLPNIAEGFAWVGNADGVPVAVSTGSFVTTPPNLQDVLTEGNSASIDLILSASLIQSGSNFSVHSDNITFRNSASSGPELIILDEQNSSFSVGPKIKFSGSNVGLIESNRNLKIDVVNGGDTVFNAGNQYLFTKNNFASGDFKITDNGSRTAFYKHENLTETGSITFANTTTDLGVGLQMTDDYAALQFYSGSAYKNIIAREANGRVKIYDGGNSTGSAGTPLMVDNNPVNNGALKWGAPYFDSGIYNFFGNGQLTFSTSAGGFSFIDIGNAAKPVISASHAVTASYVAGANVDGTVANATNAVDATNADNIALSADGTNTNRYVPFTATATGDGTLLTDPGILYNPSTNKLTTQGPLEIQGITDVSASIAAAGGGGAAFPFTGSADITGSLQVTGSVVISGSSARLTVSGSANVGEQHTIGGSNNLTVGFNNTNNTNSGLSVGSGHTVNGDTSATIGGEGNTINSSFCAIIGGAAANINNADTSVIVGGYQQSLQGARTAILGGQQLTIESGADYSQILNGFQNRVLTNVTQSTVIGGTQITASVSDTVYMPNLHTKNTNDRGSILSGSLAMEGLPTASTGLNIGDVWISGSGTNPGSTDSGYLMIKTS